ncbi:glycosyltransferase family 4 protein [Mesorhizobium sp. B2-4-4]|nr:glycosyltransferase family 4 protein [Mesorhizobium sp. B2-4-4]
MDSTPRVMWILNHTSARAFEVPMLKRIGFQEIFLPKLFPQDHNFRSASIDYSEDANLSIPSDDLEKLNGVNWYKPVAKEYWAIANRHFDVLFFIAHDLDAVANAARNFSGALIWRAYGLDKSLSYSQLLASSEEAFLALQRPEGPFFLGHAYRGIEKNESNFLASKAIYLPLGLNNAVVNDTWTGSDPRILFVCPEIGFNPYYKAIYEKFKKDFEGLPYVIGGAQPITVDDPSVLGFVTNEQHAENMKTLRVMFYHSQEPRHVHYHPFEAIRTGMPLVFMAGGLLDELGGIGQPGRAQTASEARAKIERILRGDTKFAEDIRTSQKKMLAAMTAERCEPYWRESFSVIREKLTQRRNLPPASNPRKKRIAVIVPVEYRGGSLRAAKLLATALCLGSQHAEDEAEVIFGHVRSDIYTKDDFKDLPDKVQVRPFDISHIDRYTAERAMKLRGFQDWSATSGTYIAFDDEIKLFLDTDLIVVISDRILHPILPLIPVVHVIYDYIQRYSAFATRELEIAFLNAAHRANKVVVTTEFTRQDAINFAGVPAHKVIKLPMLSPNFSKTKRVELDERDQSFIWTTNANPHKNHRMALEALAIYYEELDGRLKCNITGVRTEKLLSGAVSHLKDAQDILRRSPKLRKNISSLGDMPDSNYQKLLSRSQFLWHPGLVDNGTFSVVEAASVGVPSLSSDYPAMREMDTQFSLGLTFMDPNDAFDMAKKLKLMEENTEAMAARLPTSTTLALQSIDELAFGYWKAVSEWL